MKLRSHCFYLISADFFRFSRGSMNDITDAAIQKNATGPKS